jgi:hypothetical protein
MTPAWRSLMGLRKDHAHEAHSKGLNKKHLMKAGFLSLLVTMTSQHHSEKG